MCIIIIITTANWIASQHAQFRWNEVIWDEMNAPQLTCSHTLSPHVIHHTAGALVTYRWRNKSPFDHILFQQHLCQKLPKFVDVGWSYSVQHHCRFSWESVYRQIIHTNKLDNYTVEIDSLVRWLHLWQVDHSVSWPSGESTCYEQYVCVCVVIIEGGGCVQRKTDDWPTQVVVSAVSTKQSI